MADARETNTGMDMGEFVKTIQTLPVHKKMTVIAGVYMHFLATNMDDKEVTKEASRLLLLLSEVMQDK